MATDFNELASDNLLEKAKDKRKKRYVAIISPERNQNTETVGRQNAILRELPDINKLSEQLLAHLESHLTEHPSDKINEPSFLQGELFEILVKIENQLFDLSKESSPKRNAPIKTLTEKFVDFTHNPRRFGYALNPKRQADISFMDSDEEFNPKPVLTLFGVGEAKSGRTLDHRCYLQFRHFHENTVQSADFLNQQEDSDRHGLSEFGKHGKKIEVVDRNKFKQYLIVCSDMNITPENVKTFIKQKKQPSLQDSGLSQDDIEIFAEMFRRGEIEIRKSAFSHAELSLLLNKVLEIIETKIEQASK